MAVKGILCLVILINWWLFLLAIIACFSLSDNVKLSYWLFCSQLIINQMLSFQLWRYLIALVS